MPITPQEAYSEWKRQQKDVYIVKRIEWALDNYITFNYGDLFKKEKKHYITIWVSSDWKSGEIKTSDREFSEIGWFSWDKLPKPYAVFLENYLKGRLLP